MDTRIHLFQIVEYSLLYGEKHDLDDVKALLKDIPTLTLIYYISAINLLLYLNDKDIDRQKSILQELFVQMNPSYRKDLLERIKRAEEKTHNTFLFFWNYSNALFYDTIFKNHNTLSYRDLDEDETKRFFDAYLIINEIAMNELAIEEKDFQDALKNTQLEDFTIAKFLYQRDYQSNISFTNQITKGYKFFKYLENHPKYGSKIPAYYKSIGVENYNDIVVTISSIMIESNAANGSLIKKNIFTIYPDEQTLINKSYLDTLCINEFIGAESYIPIGRNRCLYKISNDQYFILDINNVINQLYKSQIFKINTFLNDKHFLETKAKEFSEEILLPDILEKTFKYCSKLSKNCSRKEGELCDYYIRNNNNVCIIEFKDVMINDNVKTSKQVETIFKALDLKFIKNQKGKPKGISQLFNAIIDIDENGVRFDNCLTNNITLYPVIIYTDHSFGFDGINYHYNKVFSEALERYKIKKLACIKDVIFISLDYFEKHADFYSDGTTNFFFILDEYLNHIQRDEYKMTTFEQFSILYMRDNIYATPEDFQKTLKEITDEIKSRPPIIMN